MPQMRSPGAVLTMAVMKAMVDSPELPAQAFLDEHDITVENASEGATHAHRAHLDATPIDEEFRASPWNCDLLRSPPNTGNWELKGPCSVAEWVIRLSQGAHSYLRHVSKFATTPTVSVHYPREEDRWEKVLMYRETSVPIYGGRVENILCAGEDELYDIVGCVVPIHQQQEPAVTVYRGELFCALILLNRQLRQFPVPGSYVAIIAITESRIRIHEAHVDEPDSSRPRIRMVKRIDVGIADIVGKEPALPEAWRDIMSYVCFTQEDRWLHVQDALWALEAKTVEIQPDAAELAPGETTGTAPNQTASTATDTSIGMDPDKTISTVLNETAGAASDGMTSTALHETSSTASDKANSTTPDKTASTQLDEITSTAPRMTTSMTPEEMPNMDVAKTTDTASCNAIVRTSRPPLAEINVQTNATNRALGRVNDSPRKSPRKNGSSK